MQDIELRIPVGLTASRIQRIDGSTTERAAQARAMELHDIVACYRQRCAVRPSCKSYAEYEETDVVETILRSAVDVWPADKDAAAIESVWLAERMIAVVGRELYDRYLRLCDEIKGANIVQFGLAG
jgi:hypothetical protein